METDKVLALAREAGFYVPDDGEQAYSADIYDGLCTPELIKFAALIQKQMIEDGWRQCAKGQGTTQFCGMAEHALRAAEDLRIELSEQL